MGFTGILGEALTSDEIRALIMNGQGFAVTTGQIATGAVANVMVGIEILANNVAKNLYIYSIIGNSSGGGIGMPLNQGITNTSDAGLTVNLAGSVVNQSGGATTSVASSIIGSPANTTQTTTVGNQRGTFGGSANTPTQYLQNESGIYIPKNTIGFVAAYARVVAASGNASMTIEWVEF